MLSEKLDSSKCNQWEFEAAIGEIGTPSLKEPEVMLRSRSACALHVRCQFKLSSNLLSTEPSSNSNEAIAWKRMPYLEGFGTLPSLCVGNFKVRSLGKWCYLRSIGTRCITEKSALSFQSNEGEDVSVVPEKPDKSWSAWI